MASMNKTTQTGNLGTFIEVTIRLDNQVTWVQTRQLKNRM